jgi:hypothetical protein
VAASVTTLAAARSRPALRLVDASPLVLRGSRFKSAERVRVSVYAGRKHGAKAVVAGPRGGFVARFRGLSPNACEGFGASAVGDQGSRASFKRAPGVCPLP